MELGQTRYGAGFSLPQRKPQSMPPCNQTKLPPQSRASWGLTCAVFPKAFSGLSKFNVHHPCGNHVRVTKSRQKSMLEEHIVHSDRCMLCGGDCFCLSPRLHTPLKARVQGREEDIKDHVHSHMGSNHRSDFLMADVSSVTENTMESSNATAGQRFSKFSQIKTKQKSTHNPTNQG